MDINNFCVQITQENREEIKKWWIEQGYDGRYMAYSEGAHYGKREGEEYCETNDKKVSVPVIIYEEFQQYVLGNVGETYTLY